MIGEHPMGPCRWIGSSRAGDIAGISDPRWCARRSSSPNPKNACHCWLIARNCPCWSTVMLAAWSNVLHICPALCMCRVLSANPKYYPLYRPHHLPSHPRLCHRRGAPLDNTGWKWQWLDRNAKAIQKERSQASTPTISRSGIPCLFVL